MLLPADGLDLNHPIDESDVIEDPERPDPQLPTRQLIRPERLTILSLYLGLCPKLSFEGLQEKPLLELLEEAEVLYSPFCELDPEHENCGVIL